MRRIYHLHPWELEDYTQDEIAFIFGDLSRIQNATTAH